MKRLIVLLGLILAMIGISGTGGYVEQASAMGFACSDDEDNDGDGYTDYSPGGILWGGDPDCTSYFDMDESPPPVCSDFTDNDGDGKTDYPNDPGCYSPDDTDEGDVAACANGVDDDGDGAVDSADSGCEVPWDADETNTTLPPGETLEEIVGEGDIDLTCYPTLGDFCPTFASTTTTKKKNSTMNASSTLAATAGPVYLHSCRVRTTRPIYHQINSSDPEDGAQMQGIAAYGCNVPMRSVRICGQLFRNTFVDSPTFIAAGPFDCTLQFARTGGTFSTIYNCNFWGFPNHSRTWFMSLNVQVTFPSGNVQTAQWRTSRTSAMCH